MHGHCGLAVILVSEGKPKQSQPRVALMVVAMPIGNDADLSPRAIDALRTADVIAAEDTRRIARVLAAHSIATPCVSCHEHNERARADELVARMKSGDVVALVTDAGTPAISDPGYWLVRAALDAGLRVSAVPGPSAMIAALSMAGIATDRFAFEGFLPARGSARDARLNEIAFEQRTTVFYEAARRIPDTLRAMADAFGAGREAAVVREISKTYEETVRGTLGELANRYASAAPLGEITIVVAGASEEDALASRRTYGLTVERLMRANVSLKDASTIVAEVTGRPRREVYNDALKRGANRSEE